MPGWRTWLVATIALIGVGANASESNPTNLRQQADNAIKAGRWEQALNLYLKLNEASPSPEVREQIRLALRQVKQQHRQRDVGFQQFILSMKPTESLNLYAEVLEKLSTLHAEPRRSTPELLFQAGLVELERALSDPTFQQRHLTSTNPANLSSFKQHLRVKKTVTTPQEARAAAFEFVQLAQEEIGLKNPTAFVAEMLAGACSGVDEYTLYLHPNAEQSALAAPILELAQYGLLVRLLAGEFVIDGLVPGSWAAEHTPLRKGDRILKINGVVPNPLELKELVRAIRSPGLLGHDLEIQPENHLPLPTVSLPVPMPTVFAVSLLNMRDGVGYLRLSHFKESTPREFDEAVNLLKARGARVLIVDARGNPGGSFPAAVQTAQRLLPTGIIVTTQGQSPEFSQRVFSSDAGMSAHDLPVIMLIDSRTMSAAEVVAAAWKDHERAILIGLPTYGKGAIQNKIRLQSLDQPDKPSRSGSMVVTLGQAYSPNGDPLNGVGVIPHILEPDPTRQLQQAFNKALELLEAQQQ